METGLQGEARIGFAARRTVNRFDFGVGERSAEGNKMSLATPSRGSVSNVVLYPSKSVDGFTACPDDGPEHRLGIGG